MIGSIIGLAAIVVIIAVVLYAEDLADGNVFYDKDDEE